MSQKNWVKNNLPVLSSAPWLLKNSHMHGRPNAWGRPFVVLFGLLELLQKKTNKNLLNLFIHPIGFDYLL